MSLAWALARAVESQAKEKRLVEGFEAMVEAYFEEYTDAKQLDPHFESALRAVWDVCFPAGLNDGRDFDEFIGARTLPSLLEVGQALQDTGEAVYVDQKITPTPHRSNAYTVNGPEFDGEEFDDLESACKAIRERCISG